MESQTLPLMYNASKLNDSILRYISSALVEQGYSDINPSILKFLSVFECDVNYGSEIARALGVSRQMVAKTVKELCRLGYLEQLDGQGKQKQIQFTESGECLISEARKVLADLDERLYKRFGKNNVSNVISDMENINKLLAKLLDK